MNRRFSLSILALLALLLMGCSLGEGGLPLGQTGGAVTDQAEPMAAGEAAQVRFASTLYTGPATTYEDRGSAFPGQSVTVIGRDEGGGWYQLGTGLWIVGFAVDLAPELGESLPVVREITGRLLGRVAAVRDGDTVEVVVGADRFPVRLIMVIAPPLNLPAGGAARAYQEQLLMGQQVLVESDVQDADAFGRSLRYLYLRRDGGEVLVNQAILESGLAQLAIFPPNLRYVERLTQAQAQAQSQGIGLWAQDLPSAESSSPETPPSESPPSEPILSERLPFEADPEECRYIMLPGDTLLGVARLFGVSLVDLATHNEIVNINLIRDGTVLRIPGCRGAPADGDDS